MNELVKIVGNEVFTDSMVIAQGTKNEHRATQQLIKTYKRDMEEFGKVTFQMLSLESGQKTKVYDLNEAQATFLISLMKNTRIVVDFKKKLVKQFYQMRQYITEHNSLHWQQTRKESKLNRLQETDEIKRFIEYATKQGSRTPNLYYTNFSLLADKAAGIKPKQRDNATVSQINNLILAENIINQVIKIGIKQGWYYKDIYKACKGRIEEFREITYLNVQIKENALT